MDVRPGCGTRVLRDPLSPAHPFAGAHERAMGASPEGKPQRARREGDVRERGGDVVALDAEFSHETPERDVAASLEPAASLP